MKIVAVLMNLVTELWGEEEKVYMIGIVAEELEEHGIITAEELNDYSEYTQTLELEGE